MDIEDSHADLLEKLGSFNGLDLIDTVAQANTATNDILPELRSSQCPIHSRAYQHHHNVPLYRQKQLHQRTVTSMEPRNDLLYSTNCHGGQVRRSSSQASGNSGRRSNKSNNSGELRRQEEERVMTERERTFKQDVLVGKSQKYFRPTLPHEMTSQDFVSSWIMHGSEPDGVSHFPELMPSRSDTNNTQNPTQEQTNRLFKGKRQTLKPLKTLTGEYAHGLRGSSIPIGESRPK